MGEVHAISVSMKLATDGWSTCHTYADSAPILSVYTGAVNLAVSPQDRHAVTEADVTAARGLLRAVQVYVTDVERHAQTAPGSMWERHDDPEVSADEPVPFVPVAVGGER